MKGNESNNLNIVINFLYRASFIVFIGFHACYFGVFSVPKLDTQSVSWKPNMEQ